jgi:hypothetical protein
LILFGLPCEQPSIPSPLAAPPGKADKLRELYQYNILTDREIPDNHTIETPGLFKIQHDILARVT